MMENIIMLLILINVAWILKYNLSIIANVKQCLLMSFEKKIFPQSKEPMNPWSFKWSFMVIACVGVWEPALQNSSC